MTRRADLMPPLGFPGGPCHVVQRIREEVRNPKLQGELVEDVEAGRNLSNADASKIYDMEVEHGPTGTRFKQLALTAHAQYRMDQRGITVTELRLALTSFHKRWGDLKSQGNPLAKEWERDMAYGEPILWIDPRIRLAIVFSARQSGVANIVTAYWDGQPDPRPDVCRVADAALTPGVKTLVSPKSEKNLPTDIDREKERVLPPGAAAPNAPAGDGDNPDGGRHFPQFQMNKPDNDIPDRPRTLPERGEDRGVKVKEDYGHVTRRPKEARVPSPVAVAAAYIQGVRWSPPERVPPAKRQKRQQGPEKMDSRREYKRERPRKNRDMKRRHRLLQRTQQYRKYKKWYNDNYRARGEHRFRRRSGEGIDPNEYLSQCWRLVADTDFESMTATQFDAMLERVAEGVTFTMEREAPNDEINHPGPNVGYAPSSPTHHKHKPDEKESLPRGETGPDKHLDDANPASSRVVPPGDGTMWKGDETYVKASRVRVAFRWLEAATIADIDSKTDALTHDRSTQVGPVALVRSEPKNGLWTFRVVGSKGDKVYTVKLKGVRKGRTLSVSKLDVRVSCTCPAFRWLGSEHWAKVELYQQGRPQGTASFPKVKDPDHKHAACKHVIAVFEHMPQLMLERPGSRRR